MADQAAYRIINRLVNDTRRRTDEAPLVLRIHLSDGQHVSGTYLEMFTDYVVLESNSPLDDWHPGPIYVPLSAIILVRPKWH